jgi:hypothetical protein
LDVPKAAYPAVIYVKSILAGVGAFLVYAMLFTVLIHLVPAVRGSASVILFINGGET